MADLTRSTDLADVQLPIRDDPAAYTCAHGHVDHVLDTFASAIGVLGQGSDASIVPETRGPP